jgi:hypothetical protein
MHPKRRSGRIAKELPILLLGTDTTGKVFSEKTKTVVLSRHGAGIVSRYKFAPDEVLTLRIPDSTKEAEIRLVGQIGGEPGRYVYGVAFVDPELLFWPMEFPPPESFESDVHSIVLECSLCQARQMVEHREIEEDVYSVNGNVLRYCEQCGASTPWKKANGSAAPIPTVVPTRPRLVPFRNPQDGATTAPPIPTQPPESLVRSFVPATIPPPAVATLAREPAYSGLFEPPAPSAIGATSYSTSALETLPTASVGIVVAEAPTPTHTQHEQDLDAVASAQTTVRPLDSTGKRVNRRRHMRVRVNFSACVRHAPHPDDIVECENVSKGGLCFHSRKEYAVGAMIQVAAPFSPGEPALFVHAQIKRVEELPGGNAFRYGAAYIKSA